MYIEYKGDCLTGTARIGRVSFLKSGKSLYYRGRCLETLSGRGYKANYFDVETGEYYWVSGCKKKGGDTLYPDEIYIDEDVREEYWRDIRELPEMVRYTSFRLDGKYGRRKPYRELSVGGKTRNGTNKRGAVRQSS